MTPPPARSSPPLPPSVSAHPPATNSPFDTNSTAERYAPLRRETVRQSFATAPAPCSAVNTAKRFPSAQSSLPMPASAAPLPCLPAQSRTRAHLSAERVRPWLALLSTSGSTAGSHKHHPRARAASPYAPDFENRRDQFPRAARGTPRPS